MGIRDVVDELERERAARAAGKKPHVSKAVRRARRIEEAKNRDPGERAAIAIRAILKPTFGPRMRRFDLGLGCPEEVRLDALARGAEKLLREDGFFMDGLRVHAVYAPGSKPPRVLLTCMPVGAVVT